MKTVRIRENIKKFLSDRPRNTAEILEHINSTMRHGTTSQQLGNVLSKDKDIVKVGYIKRSGILSGGYDICEWATVTWVQEHEPGWARGDPIPFDLMEKRRNAIKERRNNFRQRNSKTHPSAELGTLPNPAPAREQPRKDLNILVVKELKDLLGQAGLKVGGRKQELIARLEKHHSNSEKRTRHDLNDLNCSQLKDMCREADLKVGGIKQELIDRLEENRSVKVEFNPMYG